MNEEPHAIFSHAIRGAVYVAIGVALAKATSVVALFAFARYLRAEEFGVVTLAFVILGLIAPLKDLGLNQAAVYFRSEQAVDYASSFRLVSSAALFGATAAAVLSIPGWFGGTNGQLIVLIILSSVVLIALSFSSEIRLSRALRFRELVVADAIRTSVYATLSIVLVLAGHGVLGVAIAYVTSFAFRGAWLHRCEPVRFSFTLKREAGKELLTYGAAVTVSSLSIMVITNVDSVVVASLFGATALGFYAMAWSWSTLVALQAAFVLHQVMFPTFVLLKEMPAAIRRGIQRAVSLTATFAFPVSAVLAASPANFVSAFLGPTWIAAASLIPVFCLYAALRAIVEPLPAGFLALGRPEVLAKIQMGHAALLTLLAPVGAVALGIDGVALAVLVAYAAAAVPILLRSRDVLGLGPRVIASTLLPQLLSAGAVFAVILAVMRFISSALILPELALLYAGGLGLFLALSVVLSKGRVWQDLMFVLRSITSRAASRPAAPPAEIPPGAR